MAHDLVLVVRNYTSLVPAVVDTHTHNGSWVGQNVVTLGQRLGAGGMLCGRLTPIMPMHSMDAIVELEAVPGGRSPAASIEIGFGLDLRADSEHPWVEAVSGIFWAGRLANQGRSWLGTAFGYSGSRLGGRTL